MRQEVLGNLGFGFELFFFEMGFWILAFPLTFWFSIRAIRSLIEKHYRKAACYFMAHPVMVCIFTAQACLVFLSPLLSCSFKAAFLSYSFQETVPLPLCALSNPASSMIHVNGPLALFIFAASEVAIYIFFIRVLRDFN
jgi:hypothetical protein